MSLAWHRVHCTYFREDFPVGSKFVHRLDDWTEYRIRWGYELKVIDKIDGAFVLRHGWNVFSDINDDIHFTDASSPYQNAIHTLKLHNPPVLVIPLHPENLKIGEFYKEYGQYQYVADVTLNINGKQEKIKVLRQLNECQELVAKPFPFIYFR